MVESTATRRLQGLIRMGCKLLVDTRDLIEEVRITDMIDDAEETERKEIEDGITFLGKVTITEVATLRRLQQVREGEVDEFEEEDSWDDIADKVQVVLEELDITWPPTQASATSTNGKRLRGTQETDGAGQGGSTAENPPKKKSRRSGGPQGPRKPRKKRSGKGNGDGDGDGADNDEDGQVQKLSKDEERAQCNLRRLDEIIRSITRKPKAGAHSLWKRIIESNNGDHKTEESISFAHLLQGYLKILPGELDVWFGEVVRKEGGFKVLIEEHTRVDETEDSLERMENWSKSLTSFESKSQVHDLVHNILSIIVQVRMAEEWARREQAWKTRYITGVFEALKDNEIQRARSSMADEAYNIWFEKNRERFRSVEQKAITSRNWTLSLYKEFGSIVLLDTRWNPIRYTKDQHGEGFGSFLQYFLTNKAQRYAKGDEANNYPEELKYDFGSPLVKYHYGNESDNDFTVIETVRFITGEDSVADYVSDFIKRRRTKLGKRVVV